MLPVKPVQQQTAHDEEAGIEPRSAAWLLEHCRGRQSLAAEGWAVNRRPSVPYPPQLRELLPAI